MKGSIMVSFGTSDNGGSSAFSSVWEWGKLDDIDCGPISTTELWTIKEKIESNNAIVKTISTDNTWKVTLAGGEEYYVAAYLGAIYFIRKIDSTKIFAGSESYTFENAGPAVV